MSNQDEQSADELKQRAGAMPELNDDALARMEADIANGNAAQADTPDDSEASSDNKDDGQPSDGTAPSRQAPKQDTDDQPEAGQADEQQPAASQDSEDLSEDDRKQLSERAQKRFKKLNDENRQLKDTVSALQRLGLSPTQARQAARDTQGQMPADQGITDQQIREFTTDEYEQHIADRAQQIVQVELRKQRIEDNYRSDLTTVEDQYPELNQDHPEYDENLDKQIGDWFLANLKQNPDLRLSDFVKQVFALRDRGAEQGKKQVTQKVLKQAAQQATTAASGGVPRGGALEDQVKGAKSIDDLEALEQKIGTT